MAYPTGLSSQAIHGSGKDHPWDPSDLLRCMNYCADRGMSTESLRNRMAGRSRQWDLLLPEWDHLTALLRDEMETSTDGHAFRTYHEMRRVLANGINCEPCSGTGRGSECLKCKGTGYRNGGRCRAKNCLFGADTCTPCRGNGYTEKEA